MNMNSRPSFIESLNVRPLSVHSIETYDNDTLSMSFWEWRLRTLEKHRMKFQRMRAWSSDVCFQVDEIDASIKEATAMISLITLMNDTT